MSLSPEKLEKYLAIFDELIIEGESIRAAIKIKTRRRENWIMNTCEFETTHEIDWLRFTQWRTNCKSLLTTVIPSNNAHRRDAEGFASLHDRKDHLEYGISFLKAMKNSLERGLLDDIRPKIQEELPKPLAAHSTPPNAPMGTNGHEDKRLLGVDATFAKGEIRVLVICANPRGTDSLRLGEEDRVLHECIKLARLRDKVRISVKHAATIHDLRRALLDEQYDIIHISGHGTGQGLVFENVAGNVELVPPRALAKQLAAYSPPLKCVILNSCYSLRQGKLLSMGVPFTIAMHGPISDECAIEFTRGFYDALCSGKDIVFAYEEGCRCIELAGLPRKHKPVLTVNESSHQ